MERRTYILNTIVIAGVFNWFILIPFFFFGAPYTGDVVLKDRLMPGETYNNEFILNSVDEVSLGFEYTVYGMRSQSEKLTISIEDPNGNIAFQLFKDLSIEGSRDADSTTIIDYSTIFSPRIAGKYRIKITGAEFSTDFWINSGMMNITKRPIFLIAPLMFWFIVAGIIAFAFNHRVQNASKSQVLTAFLFSLITAYAAIYYASA